MLPEESWEQLQFYQDINQASNPINPADFQAMDDPNEVLLPPSQCPGSCSNRGICIGRKVGQGGAVDWKHCQCVQVGGTGCGAAVPG